MNPHRLKELLKDDPIVITGTGVHSAAGTDVASLWESVSEGRTPAAEVDLGDGNVFPGCVTNDVKGDDPRLLAGRRTDRSVQLALSAATEAIDQAALGGEIDPAMVAVIAGTSRGPQHQWEVAKNNLDAGKRMRPTLAATGTVACLSGLLAQQLGAEGSGFTVSATCASAANAIALGAQQLLVGSADVVIAGGSDAPIHPLVLKGMESAGMLGAHEDPTLACRPFDARRNGLIVGEGAGFLVLERASHARSRNAEVLAKLSSWSSATKGQGKTGICEDGSGLRRVMTEVLSMAGVRAEDVGYINAHGTATQLNDRVEAAVLRELFGDRVPVSSTKPVTGHCLGGTPGIEAVICVEALRHDALPMTVGLEEVDPDCNGVDHILANKREATVDHIISQSIGFWGYHACLMFGNP